MNMKKIAAVGTALLWATVTLADGVVSSIVGYGSAETQKSGLTVGACFLPINGKVIDLTDLKVTGYETTIEGDVCIQTLDEYGRTKETYYYYDFQVGKVHYLGWYDVKNTLVSNGVVTIQPGEGLWCMSPSTGYGIQATGLVPTSDVAIILPKTGGLSVANPSPVSVDLADISATGYDSEEGTEGSICIQVLNEYGSTEATYYYYDAPGYLGWYDIKNKKVSEGQVVLKPGEGLWAMSDTEGLALVFPAVSSVK